MYASGCGNGMPAGQPHLVTFTQQMRAKCDYQIATLKLTGDARAVVIQALDLDRPPGNRCRVAIDDPHARSLARVEQRADRYL
jgi:predicted signal transduction protein with EAL and GGDEF domain